MREGRCISLIERLKQGSELKSTLSIGKLQIAESCHVTAQTARLD